jgi:DNA-directed RNA polymerase specialized sigma24 family protein
MGGAASKWGIVPTQAVGLEGASPLSNRLDWGCEKGYPMKQGSLISCLNEKGPRMQANGIERLVAAAVAGDHDALEQLLLEEYPRLVRRIGPKIGSSLAGSIGVEDVIQEAFADAFRCIGTFIHKGDGSFSRWITIIAERKLKDLIKLHLAVKRGGGRQRLAASHSPDTSAVLDLLELAAVDDRTPSRSAASGTA